MSERRGWKINNSIKVDEFDNCGYNRKLKPLANILRKNMTKAESCLWKYVLKAKKMKGYQFRRQRPVLNYIADFMCKELKLIIELDGVTHQSEKAIEHDEKRSSVLKKSGFTIIRFTDKEVLEDLETVKKSITKTIENIEKVHPLNPPPAGDI